jgi:hypothetical protein
VDAEKGAHTRACVLVCAHISDCCFCGAANGDLRIPNANVTWRRTGYVYLKDDGTREGLSYRKSHVGDVGYTNVAGITDFNYRLRAVYVFECGAGT